MSVNSLQDYVDILTSLGEETIDILNDINAKDEHLRDYIVNFNNIYSTVQQFKSIIEEMASDENANTDEIE